MRKLGRVKRRGLQETTIILVTILTPLVSAYLPVLVEKN